MLNKKKIVCVLPAYNAAKTLEKTLQDVPANLVDLFIVVDDCSKDETVRVANELKSRWPIKVIQHEKNKGYGGNQKTCYEAALQEGADIVVMLHPDYQYEPRLLGALSWMVASGVYDVALGSRILGKGALKGGMPIWKYIANRFLTLIENLLIGQKLSEYHTGYRAFTSEVLRALPLETFNDDFVFDNEFLVFANAQGFKMGEVSVPTKYFPEASSINFRRSVKYGLGVLACSVKGLKLRLSK
ncbi:glycosyltransferase family 2 protein [bacterium]|nr:glycosyltransferase family 2 protein [bacterium]